MKETIIFSYTGQFALLRQLAKHGIDNVGYRVFSNNSILSYIREKTGNLSSKKRVDNREKAYLYTKFLQEDQSYFKGGFYENAKELSETIDSLRMLITSDEDDQMKNKLAGSKKYEAIYSFYKKYMEYLQKNNRTDPIEEAREIIKTNPKIDLEVLIIKGEELSPLNKKLLETCFKNVKEIEYRDLFNKNKQEKLNFEYLYRSKGYAHEVANVFKIIADKKLSIDTCTIIYTDYKNFYNPIKEYSDLLSLPVTYIDGVPSTEYNTYRMLYLITKLNDGLYGYDVLMDLIKDKSFNYKKLIEDIGIEDHIDLFLEEIGDLKFSFDREKNETIYSKYIVFNKSHIDEIKKFKDIFNKGIIDLINDYVINDDVSITSRLINDLKLYKSINNKDDFDFYKSLTKILINGSIEKEGTISVCSISKVKESIRDNIFFIGNDADSFHISLAENSYISDEKLEDFNKESANTSINIVKRKIERYKEAIQLAFDLGSNVYISYSEKDETSELKKHNLISSIYDLQNKSEKNITLEEFKNKFIPTNTYYGNNLKTDEKLIESYLDKTNHIVEEESAEENEEKIEGLLDKRYSPTQIEDNIKCKKYFLIRRILGVKDKEEYDVFDKLAISDFGSMFHETMKFANDNKNIDKVLEYAEEVFEKYRSKRNPILDIELDKDKEDFLDIVNNGYEYLSKKKQGIAEEKQIKDLDINGTTLHVKGFPDLVSGNEIIDYKAKRHITHKDEDIETCIQALIYALMNSEKNIDHVEYYYPFFDKTIKTIYNEKNVVEILNQFIDSIINNNFIAAKDILTDKEQKDKLDEICKYCNFKDICGREE